MRAQVFSREQVQQWEQRWFAAGNSSYGLMQQAAWHMTQHIVQYIDTLRQAQNLPVADIGLWCGAGNNGGDGWLVAAYLQQQGYNVWVYEVATPQTPDAKTAQSYALSTGVPRYSQSSDLPRADIDIDALFGIGLNRPLCDYYLDCIQQFNQRVSQKIALDMPSGIDANSGAVLGAACKVDLSLTVLGYKAGLLTGQGPAYAGTVQRIELIPSDAQLRPLAYVDQNTPTLPKRPKTSHKGSNGHVLVVGGSANMGGAAIMASEAALVAGAGKVTLLTEARHHAAALTRCPSVMTLTIPVLPDITTEWAQQLSQGMDCLAIGMGLGREDWGKAVWQAFLPLLEQPGHWQAIVIDADALWHLADNRHLTDKQDLNPELRAHWYCTPHPGEAARLLGITTQSVEQDRIAAIKALKQKYGGNWLLKGAGSLSLDEQGLSICGLGNPGMATAGMGDILAGMAGGLLAQFAQLPLHTIVALHAAAGDMLAHSGERGIQATDMLGVIKQVVN